MKNKKVLITVIFSVVCAVVILAVLVIGYHTKSQGPAVTTDPGKVCSFDSLEEAVAWAGFSLKCSDRLNGILATDYSADQTAITVTYGKAGYIRKTLLLDDTEEGENAPPTEETTSDYEIDDAPVHDINGLTVRFTGTEDAVSKAEWIDNGFDYVICLTDQTVTADVMTDYILATR